jgi:hypothetical protein
MRGVLAIAQSTKKELPGKVAPPPDTIRARPGNPSRHGQIPPHPTESGDAPRGRHHDRLPVTRKAILSVPVPAQRIEPYPSHRAKSARADPEAAVFAGRFVFARSVFTGTSFPKRTTGSPVLFAKGTEMCFFAGNCCPLADRPSRRMRGPFRRVPRVRLNTSLEPRRGRQRPHQSLPLRSADTLRGAGLASGVLDPDLGSDHCDTPWNKHHRPLDGARRRGLVTRVPPCCHCTMTHRWLDRESGTLPTTKSVSPSPATTPRPIAHAATKHRSPIATAPARRTPGGQLTQTAETRQDGSPHPCRDVCGSLNAAIEVVAASQAPRRTAADAARPRANTGDREHRLRIV